MTELIHFGPSSRHNKRFVAKFKNPTKTTHFGLKGANTYIDGATKQKRDNYKKRHIRDLKTGDPTRAGFLSYYVIWGDSQDVDKNLKSYLKKFEIRDSRK